MNNAKKKRSVHGKSFKWMLAKNQTVQILQLSCTIAEWNDRFGIEKSSLNVRTCVLRVSAVNGSKYLVKCTSLITVILNHHQWLCGSKKGAKRVNSTRKKR